MSPQNTLDAIGNSPEIVLDDKCLSVTDLEQILNLSKQRVYRALNSGKIPARRIGKRWMISRRGFMEWLNAPYKKVEVKAAA